MRTTRSIREKQSTMAPLRAHFWRFATVGLTFLLAALVTTTVILGQEITGPQQAVPGPRAPISVDAGSINHVNAVTETAAQTTSSTVFVNLPGAATNISVPGDETALLVARFTAESQCDGGGAGKFCSVRVLIDGVEANPASGLDFAFDSVEPGGSGLWEGNALDRSKLVGAGAHTVVVQWAVTNTATVFRLDDWSFTVERAQKA